MKPTALLILGVLNSAAVRAEPPVAISADRIRNDVPSLSCDEFLGRGPGEPGEAKTTASIAEAFRNAGLQLAGENGTWFQDAPLVCLDRQPGGTVPLSIDDKVEALRKRGAEYTFLRSRRWMFLAGSSDLGRAGKGDVAN